MSRRLIREKCTVSAMIKLHCNEKHGDHGKQKPLCPGCIELENYAHDKVDHCRYGDSKPSCGQCTTPCYIAEKRDSIIAVMRNTRRKMLYHHPLLTYFHLRDYLKSR